MSLDAADGHGADLGRLYAELGGRIRDMCRSYLGNEADAQDALHETFARAAPRLGTLSGDPKAFLFAVARNVCIDEHRRRTRAGASAAMAAAIADTPDPAILATDRLELRALK